MFLSSILEVEAGGCCSFFSLKLCRIPYPKYMTDPNREMRQWEGKVGALPTDKCQIGLLLWHLTYLGRASRKRIGFCRSRGFLTPPKATHQSPSRCQIGPRSQHPSASSGKCSQRCSPEGRQAEQGPVGRVSSSLNTPQMSELETLPQEEQEDASSTQAVCSVATETVFVKHHCGCWVWIQEGPIGFSSSLYSLTQQRCLFFKALRLHSLKVDTLGTWGHLPWIEEQRGSGAASRWWPWPQWWAETAAQPLLWARGLQRTPGWATGPGSGSGWSAGELQGSRWRRTGRTQKTKTSGPRVTPLPETTNIRKSHRISKTPSQMPKTQNPNLCCQF